MTSALTPQLALTPASELQIDTDRARKWLSSPISAIAKDKGFCVEQVFSRLFLALSSEKDLGEALRFAETGLRYIKIVDRNRLRDELGEAFVDTIEQIIDLVEEGLDSEENWIKRKAMGMHGDLIDEQAEKKRWVDQVITEDRFQAILRAANSQGQIDTELDSFIDAEVIDAEVIDAEVIVGETVDITS